MNNEIKEILRDDELLKKVENILAGELTEKEYDKFYNYFNEIKKPNIIIDIKDDENIKDYITNLQEENKRLNNYSSKVLLDYIKKLETIEQQYSAILSENTKLENKITNLEESDNVRKKFSDVIYPTMVIRSQAEAIELQEKEIERLNNIINEFDIWLNLLNTDEKTNDFFVVVRLDVIKREWNELKDSDK